MLSPQLNDLFELQKRCKVVVLHMSTSIEINEINEDVAVIIYNGHNYSHHEAYYLKSK